MRRAVRGGRGVAALAGASAACLTLAGCTSGPPDPTATADALAQALTSGDLSTVAFTGSTSTEADADAEAVLAGMSPATATVVAVGTQLEQTSEQPSALTTLTWTWDLDGEGPATETWDYTAQAELTAIEQDGEDEWQVRWSRAIVHPNLGDADVLALTRAQPDRADIIGADGTPLVTARAVQRVGIDKLRLTEADGDPEQAARDLAAIVGIDADAYAAAVVAAGDQAFVEALTLRELDAEPLREQIEAVTGARLIADELPLAPTREFARALLGTVGEATAEIVEASAGAVVAGDLVGLSGLQARYDDRLRGVPGYSVAVRSEAGETGDADQPETLVVTEPVAGEPLLVTLDATLQQLADDLLSDQQPPSALVALRPSTGELLAVSSGPGSGGYSTATLGQYAPGSVSKVVTALALLRQGVSPDDVLPCTSTVTIDGKAFTNYSDYPADALGDIALRRAFAESCNTAFVSQVDALEWPEVVDAAASLGIGVDTDPGFEAFLGSLAEPSGRVERAAGLIGQGTVLMSPLAAAVMAASASVGPVTPVLLPDSAPSTPTAVTLDPDESEQLTAMMRGAVVDGTATVLGDLPAPAVIAKTGTAEYGTNVPPDTHGWMVAVQGDLAVAVFVEDAESGSSTAGPILRDFLSQSRPASP